MKKSTKILISLITFTIAIVSIVYGTMDFLSEKKESNLKEIAIKASQKYIEENTIHVEETLKSDISTLIEKGYINKEETEINSSCINNSFVTVTNNVEKYLYDADINCEDSRAVFAANYGIRGLAIEGNILQTLIISKATKLNPVTIIIGLLIFGHFFGMVGMLLSTPIIGVMKVVFQYFDEKYDLIKEVDDSGVEDAKK